MYTPPALREFNFLLSTRCACMLFRIHNVS